MDVSGATVLLKDCYFYLLYKRKGDEQTQIPILLDKTYYSATDTISASFEPTSYFTEKNGGLDIQVFACSTEQDFVSEDVDIEDVALWTSFNAQISIAKSQLKDSQTIVAEDMFTKGIAEMSAYLDSAESEADDAEEYASDAEEFAKGTRSDGLTVPHASTGAHDNAKDYKDLAKDWASKIGGAVESGEYSAKYYAVVSDTRSQEAEAYALGTKGGTPVPTFADKNAKDWATKTGSTVDGTNYSSKQYALNAKASADIVEEHATAIDSIYADLTNIDAVATDIQDEDSIINTVAENIQDVNAVAESITDVNTVAGKTTQITTVAGISSDVTTVAGIASDVTAVAGIASDVSAVEDIKTDVSAVAAIDSDVSAVSAIKDDVSAVATIDDDVTTVATDISDVSAVASDITKVTAVADDLTNIDAVADDLTNIDNAVNYALEAEGWAAGTQNGVPVTSGSPYYENNAKYYGNAVPALKDAIAKNTAEIENLKQTSAQTEITVSYPDDGNYSALMPNLVPAKSAKYAEIKSINGKSRAWNQPIKPMTSSDWSFSGANGTISDGKATFTATSAYGRVATPFKIEANHIYLVSGTGTLTSATNMVGIMIRDTTNSYNIKAFGFNTTTSKQTIYGFFTYNRSCNGQFRFTDNRDSGWDSITVEKGFVRDITLIDPDFTLSGDDSTDLAKLVQKFSDILTYDNLFADGGNGYSLVDTVVEGVKSVGVNIWDEEWEVGQYNTTTGVKTDNPNNIRSANYIPVIGGQTYYFQKPTTSSYGMQILFYDSDKNFITNFSPSSAGGFSFTVPSNCAYITFFQGAVYGTTYKHDIQIADNSLPDAIKTEYHAHMKSTLTLPSPVTLRSAGTVAEVYDLETGEKTNPLGGSKLKGLSWSHKSGSDHAFFTWGLASVIKKTPMNVVADILFPKLIVGTYQDVYSNEIMDGISVGNDGQIGVKVSSVSSTSDLPTFFGEDELIYALATPDDPTQLTPVINNTLKVEPNGTIETVQTQSPVLDNSMTVNFDLIP